MPDPFSISKRLKSFVYAFNGIRLATISQHNFRIHIVLAAIAIALGFLLDISNNEWVAIVIVIGIVLTSELFNSSMEEIVNLVSPDKNPTAGKIKDMAAGAVLISAIMAMIVGCIIFIPKLLLFL